MEDLAGPHPRQVKYPALPPKPSSLRNSRDLRVPLSTRPQFYVPVFFQLLTLKYNLQYMCWHAHFCQPSAESIHYWV